MTGATKEIARDADTCFRLFCDLERLPEWVRGVARVVPLEVDEHQRPTLVRFISMPARASVSYSLRYTYYEDERRVCWQPADREERSIAGEAVIVPLGEDRCELRYALTSWNAASLPMWARAALKEDNPQSAVDAFQRFAESAET